MEKITLEVKGMSCAHCEKAVVNALTDLGAQNVVACAKKNKVEFEYDPAVLSLDVIVAELEDMDYLVSASNI